MTYCKDVLGYWEHVKSNMFWIVAIPACLGILYLLMKAIHFFMFYQAIVFLNIDRLELVQRSQNGTLGELLKRKFFEKKQLVVYELLNLLRERLRAEEDPTEILFLQELIYLLEGFIHGKPMQIFGKKNCLEVCLYSEFKIGEIQKYVNS